MRRVFIINNHLTIETVTLRIEIVRQKENNNASKNHFYLNIIYRIAKSERTHAQCFYKKYWTLHVETLICKHHLIESPIILFNTKIANIFTCYLFILLCLLILFVFFLIFIIQRYFSLQMICKFPFC